LRSYFFLYIPKMMAWKAENKKEKEK